MENPKKEGYGWSVALPVLLVLLTGLQTSAAQTCPVGCSGCGTTTVDCRNAGLTSFPQLPLDAQQSVQFLYLNDNNLAVLEPTVLENYRSLLWLGLDNNQLTELPEGLLSATTQLQYLGLNNNQLTELPEGLLSATTQLQYLYLFSNQLTELPEGLLSATTQLLWLLLDNNQLTELPEGLLSATTQLWYLVLDNNQLTQLPEGFLSATTQLQLLYLNNNQLTELPEGLLSATTQLTHLDLYDNPLQCDCKLSWLPEILRNVTEYLPATCATPANLNGTSVASLTEDQLVCDCVPACVHGQCNMSLGMCQCSGVDCSSCTGTVLQGPTSVCFTATSYPVRTIAQTSSTTAQCPPEEERSEVIESIRGDIHARIREAVQP